MTLRVIDFVRIIEQSIKSRYNSANWTTDRASDLVIERKRGRYGVCRKSKQSLRLYTPYGSEG